MQKGGLAKGSEEFHSENSGIERDIRGLHEGTLRSALAAALSRRKPAKHEVQLPEKEEVEQSIDSLFSFSKRAQPGKKLNLGAGIADAVSISLVSLPGLIASESIAAVKNYADTRHYSWLRNKERGYIKNYKSGIIEVLKTELSHAESERQGKEIGKLMQETKDLFSAIEEKSRAGLNTALGSRAEAFIGSAVAYGLNNSIFKPLVDWTSSFFNSLARVQPIQPSGYNPDLVLLDIIVRTGWLVTVSAVAAYLTYEAHKGLSRNSITSRDKAAQELKGRVEALYERIQEVCE